MLTSWLLNQGNRSSFLPASNPNWIHRPSPGHDPPFPSQATLRPRQGAPSYTGARHSSADRNHQAQASRLDATQRPTGGRSEDLSQLAGYLHEEDMSLTNPNTSAHWPATLRQSSTSLFSAHPPPGCPVPAPHDSHAAQAFTEGSGHPSVALRMILDNVLRSTWIHNQDLEPRMSGDYSKRVYHQVVHLNGCPAFDFSNSKTSLLTVFVGHSGGHRCCLICDKRKSSIPRALSCVRAHLQLKPFQCGGCQVCNGENGYAAFWSAALLRDHVNGQKMAKCTKCRSRMRQGNLRRHQADVHNSTIDHSRYPKHPSKPIYDSSEEEMIDFLVEHEGSD